MTGQEYLDRLRMAFTKTEESKPSVSSSISELIETAQQAMAEFEESDQQTVDNTARAVAWALCRDGATRQFAKHAVEETGMGDVDDKVQKTDIFSAEHFPISSGNRLLELSTAIQRLDSRQSPTLPVFGLEVDISYCLHMDADMPCRSVPSSDTEHLTSSCGFTLGVIPVILSLKKIEI